VGARRERNVIESVRFLLSCVVLQAHIWPLDAGWLAWQSVFGFYTLSGFLMVRILRQRYGFGGQNFCRFALNRVLRLWPAYLVVLTMTSFSLQHLDIGGVYPLLHAPRDHWDALANITVLGLVGVSFSHEAAMTLMVPNSWSLSIEMFCYLLLALYFAKSEKRLVVLALIGAVTLAWSTGECVARGGQLLGAGPYCFQSRYGVLQAGFIPFALGGLLYFRLAQIRTAIAGRGWWIASGFFIATVLIAAEPALQYTVAPFFGSLIVACLVALASNQAKATGLTDFIGRASYHLFIAQWVLAALLVRMTSLEVDSFTLCLATLALSLLMSALLVPMEHRIETLRRRLVPTEATAKADLAVASERLAA
jgi:peptidoglycan/LPS O-acetylase OafA/YrhL